MLEREKEGKLIMKQHFSFVINFGVRIPSVQFPLFIY